MIAIAIALTLAALPQAESANTSGIFMSESGNNGQRVLDAARQDLDYGCRAAGRVENGGDPRMAEVPYHEGEPVAIKHSSSAFGILDRRQEGGRSIMNRCDAVLSCQESCVLVPLNGFVQTLDLTFQDLMRENALSRP